MDPFVNLAQLRARRRAAGDRRTRRRSRRRAGARSSIRPAAASAAIPGAGRISAGDRAPDRHGRRLLPRELASARGRAASARTTIADEIVAEALEGVDGTGVRIGLIGEIGVSGDFTPTRRRACAAPPARRPHRAAAHGPPAGLVPPRPSRARHRRGGRRRSAPHGALPHEPEPRRRRLPDEPRGARRVHRVRHDRHGLLVRRPGRAVPVRRGQCAAPSGAWSTRATATGCCCRRTCS